MKKIFFTALVAVVAVGEAYAQYYYPIGSNQNSIYCPTGLTTCDVKYGNVLVSNTAAPHQPNQFFLSTIQWDGIN